MELAGPMHWLVCSFFETPAQHKFRVHQIKNDIKSVQVGLWMSIIIYVIMVSVFVVGFFVNYVAGSIFQVIIRISYILCLFMLLLNIRNIYKNSLFPWGVMMLYIFITFANLLNFSDLDEIYIFVKVLQTMFTNIIVNHISGLPVGYILTATVVNFID